jgi:putative spermidine/putrescine transport system permease protein
MIRFKRFVERTGSTAYKASVFFACAFSLLPILLVFITSFGTSQYLQFPPEGFTLHWYIIALNDYNGYIKPLIFSFVIAMVSASLAILLGTLAAFALNRSESAQIDHFRTLFLAPRTVPQIVIGLGTLIFFFQFRIPRGFVAITVSHTVVGLAFAMVFITISFNRINETLELGARDLGADRYQTTRYVTVPLVMPGIFAGWIFTFIISFNNVALSLFLIKSGQTTLPLSIYQRLQYGFSPDLAAISVIQIVVVFTLISILYIKFSDLI